MTPTLSPSELADDLPTRLAEHAELQRAWHSFELGDIAPAPLALDETAALLDEAALALREREAECEMLREHTSCCLDERDENLARIRQLEEALPAGAEMTHTPTDADVERVALAIMAASKAFADSWIDPVAIARAAIAAMPAPGVPAGWRLVPVEATEEMIQACVSGSDSQGLGADRGSFLWEMTQRGLRAALAAAPPAPASEDK
jgi:hypothetical protein